jgi:hypothetical protein
MFQMVLTPIEVAIEDVEKKICELDAAITQVQFASSCFQKIRWDRASFISIKVLVEFSDLLKAR